MHPRLFRLDPGDVLGHFYSRIRQAVDRAEETYDEIVEQLIDGDLMIDLPIEIRAGEYEELEGVGEADLRAWLVEVVRGEFSAHQGWQRGPAGEDTDAERLTGAFDALGAYGIVAREDFACCQRCGVSEIRSEGLDDGSDPRGYVFYHEQDTGDDPLHLTFDTPHGSDTTRTALGAEVVGVLRDHGLGVEWDQDPNLRIKVRMRSWRKPRHGTLAVSPATVPDRPAATGENTPILRDERRTEARARSRDAAAVPDGTVEANGFHFTVLGVRDGIPSLDGAESTLVPQGRFVVVGMAVRNPVLFAGGFSPAVHVLHDTQGRTHTFHQEATLGHTRTVVPHRFCGPGTLLTGLVFDLPHDADPSHLMVNGHARADLPEPCSTPGPLTAAGDLLWSMVTTVRTGLRTVEGPLGRRTARGRYVAVGVMVEVRRPYSMAQFPAEGHMLLDTDGNVYEVDSEATYCHRVEGPHSMVVQTARTETVLVFDLPVDAVPDRVSLAGLFRGDGSVDLPLPVQSR